MKFDQTQMTEEIQKLEYNVVTCGDCGDVLIIRTDDDYEIECNHCGFVGESCDYPDLYHNGWEESINPSKVKPMSYEEKIDAIKSSDVYKQVLADSSGGVVYNVDKWATYDADDIIKIWHSLTRAEREAQDGIMTGVMDFVQPR